eukprot:SAG31_NODE_114_length_24318_cov_16.787481_3_plen_77_part_00
MSSGDEATAIGYGRTRNRYHAHGTVMYTVVLASVYGCILNLVRLSARDMYRYALLNLVRGIQVPVRVPVPATTSMY